MKTATTEEMYDFAHKEGLLKHEPAHDEYCCDDFEDAMEYGCLKNKPEPENNNTTILIPGHGWSGMRILYCPFCGGRLKEAP